jgi:hypothetical protein
LLFGVSLESGLKESYLRLYIFICLHLKEVDARARCG